MLDVIETVPLDLKHFYNDKFEVSSFTEIKLFDAR